MKKAIYSEDHKKLVGKLREARGKANLDQNGAAKLLEKTQSYISKIESGQRRVDLVQLKEFARIYKKPLNYFISP
jgi:transcriptional regulator with XRE-family HTH domain